MTGESSDRVDVVISAGHAARLVPPQVSVIDGGPDVRLVGFRPLGRWGFVARRAPTVMLPLTHAQARRASRSFRLVRLVDTVVAPLSGLAFLSSLTFLVLARGAGPGAEPDLRWASEWLLALGFAALAAVYVIRKVAVLGQHPRIAPDGRVVVPRVHWRAAEELVARNGEDIRLA